MPYKVIDSNVYHQKNGKWTIKQHCSSPANAKAAMRLLEGLEHGTIVKRYPSKK